MNYKILENYLELLQQKLNRIKTWQVVILFLLIAFIVFYSGLHNPFMGDDQLQIVNNPPVHSIKNILLFFRGGTFYNGEGLRPLTGVYYRPIMTVFFSLIYTVFGAHSVYFHIFQLLICTASAVILYLLFSFSFSSLLALTLSLVFLIYPLNSQAVFSIPSMQDGLMFFFGLSALYLTIKLKTVKSLIVVSLLLLLSTLSKESGLMFVILSALYLLRWDRRRLKALALFGIPEFICWLVLKINAVGLNSNPNNAPIDRINLIHRLLNDPYILFFYITKLIFPVKLASGYYWVHDSLSIKYFFLPLIVDLAVVIVICYAGYVMRIKASRSQYKTYLFYCAWLVIGLLPILQIIPLDMTTCETWFYTSTAGALGIVGVLIQNLYRPHKGRKLNFALKVLLIILIVSLGARTGLRGLDYSSSKKLAISDLSASSGDYVADNTLAADYIDTSNFYLASKYDLASIKVFPNYNNYSNLGLILANQAKFEASWAAYKKALTYEQSAQVYDNMAALTQTYGTEASDLAFFQKAIPKFPSDGSLWFYFGLLQQKYGDNAGAISSIKKAASYGSPLTEAVYEDILNNQPFEIQLPNEIVKYP